MGLMQGLFRGALAGAAGTTALNTSTYLDMLIRGRGTSSTPEDMVEKLTDKTGVTIPGGDDSRPNRVSALGALNGIGVGVGVGAALGLAYSAGWRPKILTAGLVAAGVAMGATDGPMAALGVTDPRKWGTTDWLSDVVPHLAYGLVTAAALLSLSFEAHLA
jgi:hypothetical protein